MAKAISRLTPFKFEPGQPVPVQEVRMENHTEYPKWIYPDGDISRAVLVRDEDEERALTKTKRRRASEDKEAQE